MVRKMTRKKVVKRDVIDKITDFLDSPKTHRFARAVGRYAQGSYQASANVFAPGGARPAPRPSFQGYSRQPRRITVGYDIVDRLPSGAVRQFQLSAEQLPAYKASARRFKIKLLKASPLYAYV